MSKGSSPSTRGRPRNQHIDAAVLRATASALDHDGYRGVVIEEIARRADVSKAAIYRRWSDRRRLVLAVLQERLGEIEAPNTGCTLCDIHECLNLATDAYCRLDVGTLAQLIVEGASDADLRRDLMEAVIDPPRRAVCRTLVDARARGDIREDLDLPQTANALSSLVFFPLLLGNDPMTSGEVESVVSALLYGIAADADALRRRYEAHAAHDASS